MAVVPVENQKPVPVNARLIQDDIYGILDPGETVNVADLYEEGMVDIARLEGGSSFGELALVDGKPRFATIKCTQRTHFLTIHVDDYEKAREKIKLNERDEKVNFMK